MRLHASSVVLPGLHRSADMPAKKLKNLLLEKGLSEEELKFVTRAFDVIGDIAVIKVRREIWDKRKIIAEALMEFRRLRSVVAITGLTEELYRTRKLEVIAGDENLETIHKEHGCTFKVDLRRAFFSPRLAYERQRVARKVRRHETVINMFAGVGCFSIVIAKAEPTARIFSIDINPYAYEYMCENIILNRTDNVIPLLGDAADLMPLFEGRADRVLMPLPERAAAFLRFAADALKEQGVVHYYTVAFANSSSPLFKRPIEEVNKVLSDREVKIEEKRVVRSVGPRKYHVVLDLLVRS